MTIFEIQFKNIKVLLTISLKFDFKTLIQFIYKIPKKECLKILCIKS